MLLALYGVGCYALGYLVNRVHKRAYINELKKALLDELEAVLDACDKKALDDEEITDTAVAYWRGYRTAMAEVTQRMKEL